MQTEGPKYTGEPSLEALANGLGTLGRYGDDYMVHAAHGETVIPAEILAANPQLKHDLFRQMRMMGIKNPNRYVVGNALNSINPLTGQPEFFFKKIFRAVRKVFKKVAPIVVPIIGNMIAPGIGGPIASALLTKVQGGDWGDALKSAAFSYGAQALGSGIRGLSQAQAGTGMEGFWTGLKKGALAPYEAASNLFASGDANPLAQGIFGPRGAGLIFDSAAPTLGTSFSPAGAGFGRRAMDTIFPAYNASLGQSGKIVTAADQQANQLSGLNPDGTTIHEYGADYQGMNLNKARAEQNAALAANQSPVNQTAGDVTMSHRGTGPAIDQSAATTTGGDVTGDAGKQDFLRFGERMGEGDSWLKGTRVGDFLENNPGLARVGEKVLTNVAGPAAVAGLTYWMADDEDQPSDDDIAKMTDPQVAAWGQYNAQRTRDDWDTWRTTPEAQNLLTQAGIYGPQYTRSQIANITGVPEGLITQSYAYGNASGGIASLQGGGEVMGPGTGTSDSIPARLSDGEFVMTAEAVRNAGKGNRNLGAARMYDLMQRFEGAPA